MAVVETNIAKVFQTSGIGFEKKELKEWVAKNPKETAIVDVLAYVSKYQVIQNRKDQSKSSLKFFGNFECVNVQTGEEVISGQAFFPGPAEPFLKGVLDSNEGAGARIAFTITVMKDTREDSITGYKFGMKAHVDKATQADPFKDMRDLLPARPKAIAAKK